MIYIQNSALLRRYIWLNYSVIRNRGNHSGEICLDMCTKEQLLKNEKENGISGNVFDGEQTGLNKNEVG